MTVLYGQLAAGVSILQVRISNTGTGPLEIGDERLKVKTDEVIGFQNPATAVKVIAPPMAEIAAAQNQVAQVSVDAADKDPLAPFWLIPFQIRSNDPDEDPYEFTVQGTFTP